MPEAPPPRRPQPGAPRARAPRATAAAAAALFATLLAAPAGAETWAPLAVHPSVAGRFVLRGTAHVHAPPEPDRTVEVGADATVEQVPGSRFVRLRLTWGRASCVLAARADGTDLSLPPGQPCDVALEEPELRGRVAVRLRAGRGRVEGSALALQATFDVDGSVSVRLGGGVDVLGTRVPVPGAWSPATPVRGFAEVSARGDRLEPGR